MEEHDPPTLDYATPSPGITAEERSNGKFCAAMTFFVAFVIVGFPLREVPQYQDAAAIAMFLLPGLAALASYHLSIRYQRRNRKPK